MVTRYRCDSAGMFEHEKGYFVKHEDYEALELKVLAALSHLERASEAANLGLQAGYLKMALRVLQNG